MKTDLIVAFLGLSAGAFALLAELVKLIVEVRKAKKQPDGGISPPSTKGIIVSIIITFGVVLFSFLWIVLSPEAQSQPIIPPEATSQPIILPETTSQPIIPPDGYIAQAELVSYKYHYTAQFMFRQIDENKSWPYNFPDSWREAFYQMEGIIIFDIDLSKIRCSEQYIKEDGQIYFKITIPEAEILKNGHSVPPEKIVLLSEKTSDITFNQRLTPDEYSAELNKLVVDEMIKAEEKAREDGIYDIAQERAKLQIMALFDKIPYEERGFYLLEYELD